MNLQNTTEINVDFSTQKYISLDAKQYDRSSRFILVTCYNRGQLFPIDNNNYFAYVRYRKSDNYGVFNTCDITNNGRVIIELTEQMLATAGISYVDLVIHEGINIAVHVDDTSGTPVMIDTGENSILSTMTFIINVHEACFDNNEVESSYEYNALNDLLIEARRNYSDVMTTCNEYKNDAATSASNASTSESNAKASELNAKDSETKAKESETNAKDSETKAKESETNAKASESNAKDSEAQAKISETNAKASEESSANYSEWSKSYAIGGTGLRDDEDIRNSEYFYDQLRRMHTGTTSGIIPMGTIQFSELATAEKQVGYLYNISTDFTTDDTFREGAGNTYEAGTMVYYTNDGKWDCLVGMTISIASLEEVKGYLNI